ncbi:hypothetical protein A3B51_01295 [Candidatus Curtissbacteria bacterium RIFCSPLOWO2_01_FULL_41_18]|uniref:Uncharacterized protein n=2 Tax=Candidatus Curtissiibacteriota TaxID=1752717 RepID=A0A1F5FZL0_9BACT|nr:MAG: hypothetical protein A2696_00630 [Candidatus Curtissbacteria bacterium RIFCSPHIGHO2_01_FULL_41_13]OGE03622.1 MAG: hypothetical protein A3B51_01295 [Candidatus Curtissbacteria bacterium RIFCSPLOWO2_01_FULL_41_18]
MAGGALAERGVSTGPEMKLTEELAPDEIARRTGGSLEFFRSRPLRINYKELGAMVDIDENGHAEEAIIFREGKEVKFELYHTIAILGEGFVTFVEPVYRHSSFSGTKRFSWLTISEEDGLTMRDLVVREREEYPEDIKGSGIPEAARFAEEKFHPGVKRRF